jgi:probable HAF family extracellular repeat protein
MLDLGTLGGTYGQGNSINASGEITGSSALSNGNIDAFLYNGSGLMDLGTLGGSASDGLGINSAGIIVGSSSLADNSQHAFIYQNGVMIDLNTLVDPVPGITLNSATAINDAGQIVANGVDGQAYLLTPVAAAPEPATWAMFAGALGLTAFAGRMRLSGSLRLRRNS